MSSPHWVMGRTVHARSRSWPLGSSARPKQAQAQSPSLPSSIDPSHPCLSLIPIPLFLAQPYLQLAAPLAPESIVQHYDPHPVRAFTQATSIHTSTPYRRDDVLDRFSMLDAASRTLGSLPSLTWKRNDPSLPAQITTIAVPRSCRG